MGPRLQQTFEMKFFRTDASPKSLCFRLNTSSSTASKLAAVRAVHGLQLPDFLVIDPVCFKRLAKLFNVFFFQLLAGNSFISLNAPQRLAKYNFFDQNSVLYTKTHHFVICLHQSCRLLRCHGNGSSWYSAILIIFLPQSIEHWLMINFAKYYW